MEDRTQTKLLSTQKELSFSRSIYSTLWGEKKSLDDERSKRKAHSLWGPCEVCRVEGTKETRSKQNTQTWVLFPRTHRSQGAVPPQGLLVLAPAPLEVSRAAMMALWGCSLYGWQWECHLLNGKHHYCHFLSSSVQVHWMNFVGTLPWSRYRVNLGTISFPCFVPSWPTHSPGQAYFPVVMITMVVMAMILLSQPSSPIFKYVKSGKEFEKLGTAKPPFRGTNKSQKPFFLSFRSLQKSQVTQETTW